MAYQYRPIEDKTEPIVRREQKTTRKKLGIFLWVLALLSSAFLVLQILIHGLLPVRYRMIFIGIFAVILLLLGILAFIRSKQGRKRWGYNILIFLFLAFTCFVNYYMFTGLGTLSRISSINEEVVSYSLVTHKDSPIQREEQLKETPVLAALEQDKENLDEHLPSLEENLGIDLEFIDTVDYIQGAGKLLEDKNEPMLLNEAYRSLILEQYPEFNDEVVTFSDEVLTIVKEKEELEEKVVEKNENFIAYISGIDTTGPVSTVSRSDVNIIMAVNNSRREILMLSVPRDSYLPIAGGGNDQYDKLTHAGIYGINSSIGTLENLIDQDINYYARVNFTSLVDLVDVLGGIEVENPRYFTAKGHEFPEGTIHLDGDQALTFSRERYNLSDGDLGRGQNQLRVIQAMINKAVSPSILFNYGSVLNVAENSMETNMPNDKIVELINDQIDDGTPWTFESIEIEGEGVMGLPSYAMPGYELYMYDLYDESVQNVRNTIESFMK